MNQGTFVQELKCQTPVVLTYLPTVKIKTDQPDNFCKSESI